MRTLITVIAAVATTACAQSPSVSTTYYLAKSRLHTRIVRTLGCDVQNHPVVASTMTPLEVIHSADTATPPETLDLSKVDRAFANTELKTEFYSDGRLKAVNATSVGQGETILKTAISLATLALEDPGTRQQVEIKCKEFKRAFADKTLTLSYELWDDLALKPAEVPILPTEESAAYNRTYRLLLGDLCLRKGAVTKRKPTTHAATRDVLLLKARQPAIMELAISTGPMGACGTANLWSGTALVAQHGETYTLPIPRARLFGKQVFAASFDEAGALTSLGYNKDSGAAPLLATIQAGADALNTTAAEEAAALKSEADVIAAQQRLVSCRADPKNCK